MLRQYTPPKLEAVPQVGPSTLDDPGGQDLPPDDQRTLELVPASSIAPQPTLWAWQDRIPLGGATLLAGQEGIGKTTLLADLLARASQGQLNGDLISVPVASVYATAEDSWARTLRPRLEAAGADLGLVHFVEVDGFAGGLQIPADLDLLVKEMERVGALLLVLDPLGAHLHGTLDTHRDASVRQAMAPLAATMDRLGGAAIGIMHWSKTPTTIALDRVNGSRGFTAAARAVLAVGDDPEDTSTHIVVVAKSNLGRLDVPALRYRIEGRSITGPGNEEIATSGVVWLGEAPGVTARDLFAAPVDEDERSDRDAVGDVIRETLKCGPQKRADVLKAVKIAGLDVSEKTFQRACHALGVDRRRQGFGPNATYVLALPIADIEDTAPMTCPVVRYVQNDLDQEQLLDTDSMVDMVDIPDSHRK
ncbi:MAG TPA: AAA family ATPase [Acidimicrobiales bacterium]|nr:AAA family ATPase [Acidimicrobiales bacterium]